MTVTYVMDERVYVRELDVFGRVTQVVPNHPAFRGETMYQVTCEHPLPEFIWLGKADRLAKANQYEGYARLHLGVFREGEGDRRTR